MAWSGEELKNKDVRKDNNNSRTKRKKKYSKLGIKCKVIFLKRADQNFIAKDFYHYWRHL